MKKLLLLLLPAFMFSCKPAASLIYGANRNLTFNTRQEVADFYQKKNGLDPASLYFFDKHADYERVLTSDTTRLNSLPYYGIAINDLLMVDDRSDVKTSCVGISASYLAAYNGNTAVVPNPLKGAKLTNIYGEPLLFDTGKPTAVLMAHSNYGRTLKSDLKYYKKTTEEAGKEYNYIVIAMDVPRSDYPKKEK